ncbi:MAG: bifunctional phosphoribosylaminoimidazolecarboxamide formyltransferase/IMP cyclohydrolase [Phycisphaerales bacterium]|nr:bifunctional phosphoribosylaminoimidazolecarboxamide formyltransferase/IMP cyclohydrolase [Phycisphaerales bacterium]
MVPIGRALVSVSEKSGLGPFVRSLVDMGVEIISTGGTAAALQREGIKVTLIEQVTGFPEIMDGRVKTLHPKVHGGLLGVRDNPAHAAAMATHAIAPIDLVCVNLYPFEETIAREGVTRGEAIEQIDIGGPSMVRSAAKNHAYVTVVTSPTQYARVLSDLSVNGGKTSRQLRRWLAAIAFSTTAKYDAAIASYLSGAGERFPDALSPAFIKHAELRYGENPHQAAAVYRDAAPTREPSIIGAAQLHGKELSFNNVNDAAAALDLARALRRVRFTLPPGYGAPVGACIVKHTNPCGAAIAPTVAEAVDEAIMGDPVAAYGGILAVNAELDGAAASRLCRNDVFLEVIVAPSFSDAALEQLRARWANVRLLAVGELRDAPGPIECKFVPGGLLVQECDRALSGAADISHRAGPMPTESTLQVAGFLEAVCRALTSNAIVIGGVSPERGASCVRVFGAGAGQMDRVNACRIARRKAGKLAKGAVAFSDAFFPFPDGPKKLINAGVTTIAHPGGSKRDQDTFDLCQQSGVTCLTTGIRHFRH